jgi:hypothetical protein
MSVLTIDYICLPPLSGVLDGRTIYDSRVIESFRAAGADVNVIEVDVYRSLSVKTPVWAHEVSTECLDRLRVGARKVVSHELLIPLVLELEPDIFIIHNYFPAFSWRSWSGFQLYCRLGATNHFKAAMQRAKHTIVLSIREKVEIAQRLDMEVVYEPPGLGGPFRPDVAPIDLARVRRTGSTHWYPKRRCSMSEKEIKNWFGTDVDLGSDLDNIRCFALIEDRFLCGFKLKLLEHLYHGDFIISRADLRAELKGLGVSEEGFFFHSSGSFDLGNVQRRFRDELSEDFVKVRRQYLEKRFSWNAIVERIILSCL